jgi:NO-binding membrane sensor protein with MHYT domain
MAQTDPSALAGYYITHAVPLEANAGVIVASVIVSILGSYATLLLLGRRSGDQNIRSHLFMALGAICFATIGIWGMHFISFQAFRLRAAEDVLWTIRVSWVSIAVVRFRWQADPSLKSTPPSPSKQFPV